VLVVDSWVSGLSPEGETEKNFSYKACVTNDPKIGGKIMWNKL